MLQHPGISIAVVNTERILSPERQATLPITVVVQELSVWFKQWNISQLRPWEATLHTHTLTSRSTHVLEASVHIRTQV